MESLHSISLVDITANESQLQDHEIVLLLEFIERSAAVSSGLNIQCTPTTIPSEQSVKRPDYQLL